MSPPHDLSGGWSVTAVNPRVTPEIAVAAAIALAKMGAEEEVAAAVAYALYRYVSDEGAMEAVPAAAADGEGQGFDPWSMAGRMHLMNGRSAHMSRGQWK